MWIFLAFLCLWALFSCTAAFPIQDDEFKIDSNFSQGIGKPSPFPADPYELFNMVHFSYPELVFGGQIARPGQFPQQAFLFYKSGSQLPTLSPPDTAPSI
ncbi:hypothetical protein L596_020793 [Steinernema carpocapsae]|uniref:Peptidase M12A domain-containing protein n=1 Tax=Steinernema carpocapsae TaxID=34508 RepID=A0A4U5MUS4_STECR|nr:hypothetical protein L596_020793 [Steinernema carpocapsae]